MQISEKDFHKKLNFIKESQKKHDFFQKVCRKNDDFRPRIVKKHAIFNRESQKIKTSASCQRIATKKRFSANLRENTVHQRIATQMPKYSRQLKKITRDMATGNHEFVPIVNNSLKI